MIEDASLPGIKQNSAFEGLLARLDRDRERAGEKYLRLLDEISAFLRVNNCSDSLEAAEEALDRTAFKISKGEDVQNVRAYAFRVARFVLLERRRAPAASELPEDYENRFAAPEIKPDERLNCLEECLEKLDFIDREIIVNYYEGEGRAKADLKRNLTERFDLSMTALKLRAMRARQKLEKCITDCVARK